MKHFCIIVVLFTQLSGAFSQDSIPPPKPAPEEKVDIEESIIVGQRETEPQFPGGPAALSNYIHTHFNRDCIQVNDSILEHSKIYLSFNVEEDGSITGVSVNRSIGKTNDDCYTDFIRQMPVWVPATDAG